MRCWNERGGACCTELLLREWEECGQPGLRLVLSSGQSLSPRCLGPARRTKTPDRGGTESRSKIKGDVSEGRELPVPGGV